MLKNLTKVMAIVLLLALLVPSATAVLAQEAVACDQDYSVQADDWLSKLADKFYGDVLAYPAIFDATNAVAKSDSSYATIANADLIEPGWKLCIPSAADAQAMMGGTAPAAAPAEAPAAGGKTYVLVPKNLGNPYFDAANTGAQAAAKEL